MYRELEKKEVDSSLLLYELFQDAIPGHTIYWVHFIGGWGGRGGRGREGEIGTGSAYSGKN